MVVLPDPPFWLQTAMTVMPDVPALAVRIMQTCNGSNIAPAAEGFYDNAKILLQEYSSGRKRQSPGLRPGEPFSPAAPDRRKGPANPRLKPLKPHCRTAGGENHGQSPRRRFPGRTSPGPYLQKQWTGNCT